MGQIPTCRGIHLQLDILTLMQPHFTHVRQFQNGSLIKQDE